MEENKSDGACTPSVSSAGLCVGGRVKLLKSIFDDGEDHHPPGWIAEAGEVLIVKEVRGDVLAVAHEGNPGAFTIYPGEYEAANGIPPPEKASGGLAEAVKLARGGDAPIPFKRW